MKRWAILILAGLVALCLGCGSQEQPQKPVTSGEVKQKVGEAATTTKEYLAQQQAQYYKQAQEKLTDMNQKINELRQEAEKQTGEAKKKLEDQTASLQKQMDETKSKLGAMKESSSEAWQKMKSGLDNAMQDLQKAYNDAKSEMKK